RKGGTGYGWLVDANIDGVQVETEIDVLGWSDLVRNSMSHGIFATYYQLFRTSWIYLSTGTLRRLMWLRKGPVIAALYPVAVLLAQALLAIIAAALVGTVVSRLSFGGLGWVVALPIMVFILQWFRDHDSRFFAYYLMHDYAFSAGGRGENPPELEARMIQFRNRIAAALKSDVDEVLVVGHSSGAHLAVSILADLIRGSTTRRDGPALALLSLGQVVPMVSFLPNAQRLRADLHDLSMSDALSWVDVSAPGDGCSFALCDPVAVSGVAAKAKRWPIVFSAAFTQSLSPGRWQQLKRKYFKLHFQYLCAFDRPKDYDYFQITAGPLTLAERYANRPPSKSRIDVPASLYTSMVA
ncbi:MAG: hypothetical protein ACC619_03790, partial [Paracoccaceae bacterium]